MNPLWNTFAIPRWTAFSDARIVISTSVTAAVFIAAVFALMTSYGVESSVAAVNPETERAAAERDLLCRDQTWPYIDNRCIAGRSGAANIRIIKISRP